MVETFEELGDVAAVVRGGHWYRAHKQLIAPVESWGWKDARRSFLFLGTPRLVFNPPVKKEKLQKGKGWLSKRFLSFDTLFDAWGC